MEHFVFTHNVKVALVILYAVIFLLLSTVKIAQIITSKDLDNIWIRLKSFLAIVIFFTLAFCFNKLCAFLFLALISYLSLKEFLSLIPTRKTDRNVLLWAYCSIPATYYIIYINWVTLFYLFIPLYMFILISVRMVLSGNTQGFLKNLAVIQCGLMTTIYALGYLGMIAIIPMEINPKGGALGLLFYILVLTVANDFMQMFSGKLFGKHKIIPNVSPNKTWEGFIGGIIGTTILSVIMGYFITPFTIGQLIFAGIVLAIFGFFGDVTMSAIKRDLGVKDTSTLIPGHGGILDRLDSLLFTAPLFYHYTAYIYHIVIPR
ncbi:MAG: phosphatidate cytidylyltransferase [Candidatus Gastranaerophilales bacterium]|nr:phosphatidate cytidylyltransferase [Candidatus Gastranaerophilales bacterium]